MHRLFRNAFHVAQEHTLVRTSKQKSSVTCGRERQYSLISSIFMDPNAIGVGQLYRMPLDSN